MTVYRPDIAGLLPLYVADRYEGIEARPFQDLDEAEVDRYLERNVAAVREVAERARPDVALANHLVMGPVILARALEGLGVPYAVKIHGSALEYTVKRHPERFMPFAREGLAGAARRARRLAPHRGEPVGGDGRPGAARPHAARARPASTSSASRRASPPRPAPAWRRLRGAPRGAAAGPPARRPAPPSRAAPARRPRRSAPSARRTGSWSSSAS